MRSLLVLAVLFFNSWTAATWGAELCQLPPGQRPVYVDEVAVIGLSSVEVQITVPEPTEVLVTLRPASLDARLEGTAPDGTPTAAENPVRRLGARRLVVNTGNQGTLVLRVTGKEPQVKGTARLEVVPLAAWRDVPGCLQAYRLMAEADAHYARARLKSVPDPRAHDIDAPQEYRAAVAAYEAAANALARGPVDRLLAEALLAAAATHYQVLSEWAKAADEATRARTVFRLVGDSYAAARAGSILAGADMELALEHRADPNGESAGRATLELAAVQHEFMEIAGFHSQRHERFEQAFALNNAGLTDYYAGQFERGMRAYKAALSIYTRLNETPRAAQVLQNMALMEYELGEFPQARRDYARALEVNAQNTDTSLRGEILNNLALAEYAAGDLDSALEHYGAALEILERSQVPLQVARSLHGLGIVYYAAGDRARALDYFKRALNMRSADHDARGRAATLRAMASVLRDLGRAGEAVELRREALALAVVPTTRVRIEAQLASDLEATGQKSEAMAEAARAVDDGPSSPRSYQALAVATRAQLEYEQGLLPPAKRDIDRALGLLNGSEVATDEFSTWVLAARIAQARGARREAQAFIDRALTLAEQMRLESANPELRAGIWGGVKAAFDLKIDLLAGNAEQTPAPPPPRSTALKTLVIAEMSRARSLADYWRGRGSAGGEGDAKSARLRELYAEIANRRFELEVRLDRSGESDPRSLALRADVAKLRREVDSLHRARATADGAGRETAAGVQAVLAKAIEMIPADSAVVEYWLGTTRARAWVITRDGVRTVDLGASDALDASARTLHTSLRAPLGTDHARLIAAVSSRIIATLPPDALRYRWLVIIPDGALHYVPFAVLNASAGEGSPPLVTDHIIVTAPSLTAVLWHRGAESAQRRLLVVSDPAYSDSDTRLPPETAARSAPVLSPLNRRFERLPATAVEASAIARLFDSSEVDRLSGFDASRRRVLGLDLSSYRIIHIAAHAVVDTAAPSLSALVLSLRDAHRNTVPGEVFAGELSVQKLNAELVVLSACDTALGTEVTGEGLLGLRYAVHAAGAESVLASLWPVTERTTTDLMTGFYTRYIRARRVPAEALAEAMRETRERFPDPALWAAFELSAAGGEGIFGREHNQR